MKLLMKTVTHKKRVWIAALIIFVSNIILAFSFAPFLVKTDSRLQYYLNLFSFMLIGVAAALADATIVGYFRCFHKDLVEPWGTGTSIAQFFNVFSNFYTTNYDMDDRLFYGYFTAAFATSIPLYMCYKRIEGIRVKASLKK